MLIKVKREEIISFRDRSGSSLLHLAAKYDVAEPITLMVSAGIPVNVSDNNGDTPMIIAIINNSKEAINSLMEQTPDLLKRNKMGYDAMDHARSRNNAEIIALLEQK